MDDRSLSVAALILAGGKSSRMGRDKAVIAWDGVPLLDRVCNVAAECCQQVYILTPWPDRYLDTVTATYNFLPESNPGQGPLVGLAEGLTQLSADWVLLLACDMPLLESAIIRNWANHLTQLSSDTLAFVPKQTDLWQPLCGFYRKEALGELQKFIDSGGRSFQTWLERVPVQVIPVGEREAKMLWNCNTPEDLEKFGQSNYD